MKSQHMELQQVTDDLHQERQQRESLEEQLKQLREQLDTKEQSAHFLSSIAEVSFVLRLEKTFD